MNFTKGVAYYEVRRHHLRVIKSLELLPKHANRKQNHGGQEVIVEDHSETRQLDTGARVSHI